MNRCKQSPPIRILRREKQVEGGLQIITVREVCYENERPCDQATTLETAFVVARFGGIVGRVHYQILIITFTLIVLLLSHDRLGIKSYLTMSATDLVTEFLTITENCGQPITVYTTVYKLRPLGDRA